MIRKELRKDMAERFAKTRTPEALCASPLYALRAEATPRCGRPCCP
jgi:hypothetical protein